MPMGEIKKWVEARTVDGKPAEVLMENCDTCGQPWARRIALRLSREEIDQWIAAGDIGHVPKWKVGLASLGLVTLMFTAPAGIIYLLWDLLLGGLLILAGLAAFFGIFVTGIYIQLRLDARDEEKIRQVRQRILDLRYQDIDARRVGTLEQELTYVILPAS